MDDWPFRGLYIGCIGCLLTTLHLLSFVMVYPNQAGPRYFLSQTRIHALDATRAFALLIGIVYHSLESLIPFKVYNAVQDTQSSAVLDGVYYLCHIFRMHVFFLMAGFFAHLLYHQKGPNEFILNRTKRLLIPLLVFWPINYLAVAGLWVLNIQRSQGLSARQAFAKLPPDFRFAGGIPLMHLWFLYFLMLFCLMVFFLYPLANRWVDPAQKLRRAVDQGLAFTMKHWWGGLALGCLMIGPMLNMSGFLGVDTASSSFWPEWAPFTLYGLYFLLGWLLHRCSHALINLRQFRTANLALGILLVAILFSFKVFYDPVDLEKILWLSWLMDLVYGLASMVLAFTCLGFMLAYFSEANATVRYVSDASYWGYLFHFPVVVLFQTLVAPYSWHWSVKLFLILVPTLIIMVASYHLLVRTTWIGKVLNGRKKTIRQNFS